MAASDIKAPVGVWIIGTIITFVGFFQLNAGLKLLRLAEKAGPIAFPQILIGRVVIGIYLLVIGIGIACVLLWGRILVLCTGGAGIILSFLGHNWLQFILGTDASPYASSVPKENIIWQIALSLALVIYLAMNPKVAEAFRRAKLQRMRKLEEEKIF